MKPVLAADGKPTSNRCVAYRCGEPIPPPRCMCQRHWAGVPRHLRQAFDHECKWLSRKQLPPDQHSLALLNIIASRELQHRIQSDPKVREQVDADAKEQIAKAKAAEAGLLGADGKPVGAPR